MIEVDDLKSFVEVVESGGFNRAAKRLGISKSIVSRRIARMETELGVRLLSRTTRGINPTEAGLEFKARSERILAELEEAREAVARQGGGVVGRLRLAAPLSFGVRYIAPALADLAERHPGLEIDVSYNDRVVDLIGERFDAAIRIGALKDSTLVARRIAPMRAVLVASLAYLARHGRPSRPIESGILEPLLLDYPAPESAIHVVRPPGSYVPGKVRVLIDALVERFADAPDWDRCLMKARDAKRHSQP